MTLRATLLSMLKSNVASVSNRVYGSFGIEAPARPYLRFQVVSDRRIYSFGGSVGFSVPHVQIDVFADSYDDAAATAAEVVTAMDGWAGATNVKMTGLNGQADAYEPDTKLFHVLLQYVVLFGW